MAALNKQPTTVSVEANLWKSYASGIMNDSACGTFLNTLLLPLGTILQAQPPTTSSGTPGVTNGMKQDTLELLLKIEMESYYPVV